MKNLIIVFVLTIAGFSLAAQVEVSEGTKTMREGTYIAYTVTMNNVPENEAKDGWEDYMKEFKSKVKRDKKAKLYVSDNVQIPSLGLNPIDVYTMITKNKTNASTTVNVWFDTGSGYVNSIDMAAQSETASNMVSEYATNVLRKNAENAQKDEENIMKDLSKDAKKLEDKNKNLRKDIADAKSEILKWEKELEQNEDDIKKKAKDINSQEEVLQEAKKHTRKF